MVYEDADHYRGVRRRDVILLHPDDMARLQLSDSEVVTVEGPAGCMAGITATSFSRIRPGNAAMYFPEANQLVARTNDPLSKTPAFKGVVVRVVANASPPAGIGPA